jgi:hypothetical protein
MDDSPIHRLQIARAIWGEKYYFNIFQSSGISWVCSPLVNEEQEFSVLCPYLVIQLHKTLFRGG